MGSSDVVSCWLQRLRLVLPTTSRASFMKRSTDPSSRGGRSLFHRGSIEGHSSRLPQFFSASCALGRPSGFGSIVSRA